MPSIYQLKPAFQGLLRPLVRALARVGITANQVTVLAVLLCAVAGAAVARVPDARILLLLPPVLFLRMALNAIDGMLAREHAQQSRLGAILNELGDVVGDAALYLPLALRPEFPPTAVVVFVLAGVLVEMAGVVAVQVGARRRYDGFGKSDRAFVVGALGLAVGLGWLPVPLVAALLWVAVALSAAALVTRARRALGQAGEGTA